MLAWSRLQGKLENQSCSIAQGLLWFAIQAAVKPTVIKPNNEELSQLLGKEVGKDVETKFFRMLSLMASKWVIVSLGAKWRFAKHGMSSIR